MVLRVRRVQESAFAETAPAEPSMLVDASNRFRIEQALRKAIKGGEFLLHYQPQVDIASGRVTGAPCTFFALR